MLSLISFIFDPPLPMREPHCEAGTMSLRLTPPASRPRLLDPEEVLAPSLAPPPKVGKHESVTQLTWIC